MSKLPASIIRFYAAFFLFIALYAAGIGLLSPNGVEAAENRPSLQYIFAHRFLPQLVHQKPQLALDLVVSAQNKDLLTDLWRQCVESNPGITPQDPAGLSVSFRTAPDYTILLLITMPEPVQPPEAYYICMIIPYTVTEDKTLHASAPGYYTLEKCCDTAESPDAVKPARVETSGAVNTIIGGLDKDGRHHNYGRGPAPGDPDAFIYAAKDLYLLEKEK